MWGKKRKEKSKNMCASVFIKISPYSLNHVEKVLQSKYCSHTIVHPHPHLAGAMRATLAGNDGLIGNNYSSHTIIQDSKTQTIAHLYLKF